MNGEMVLNLFTGLGLVLSVGTTFYAARVVRRYRLPQEAAPTVSVQTPKSQSTLLPPAAEGSVEALPASFRDGFASQLSQLKIQRAELSAARDRLQSEIESLEQRNEDLKAELAKALERTNEIKAEPDTELRAEADRQKKRADEFFRIIESVLAERDQWREMWHTHGRAHLEAQNMMEAAITEARSVAKQALSTVNKYRTEKGQAAISWGTEPGDKPIGSAAKFRELLDKAEREAPKSVEGLALRNQVMRNTSDEPYGQADYLSAT